MISFTRCPVLTNSAPSKLIFTKRRRFLKYYKKGMGYIRYRPPYAEYRLPYWKDGANRDHSDGLGLIIDRERNIFFKNEYGVFSFTVDDGMIPIDDSELTDEQLQIVNKKKSVRASYLDFGYIYISYMNS
jgi:hypothetical protein